MLDWNQDGKRDHRDQAIECYVIDCIEKENKAKSSQMSQNHDSYRNKSVKEALSNPGLIIAFFVLLIIYIIGKVVS